MAKIQVSATQYNSEGSHLYWGSVQHTPISRSTQSYNAHESVLENTNLCRTILREYTTARMTHRDTYKSLADSYYNNKNIQAYYNTIMTNNNETQVRQIHRKQNSDVHQVESCGTRRLNKGSPQKEPRDKQLRHNSLLKAKSLSGQGKIEHHKNIKETKWCTTL